MKYGLFVLFMVVITGIVFSGCMQADNIVPSSSATPVGTAIQDEPVAYSPVPAVTETPKLPPGTIIEIYNETIDLTYGGEESFPYDLVNTPMVVTFKVYPVIVEYEKFLSRDVGYIANTTKHWSTVTMEDPEAWAEVKLVDRNTGNTLKAKGYNGDYSSSKFGEITMTLPGSYEVKFAGNKVTINATITAPV